MRKKGIVLLTAISLCLPFLIFGETVILKSGETIEGKIVNRTREGITLLDIKGSVLKYKKDEIEKIIDKVSESGSQGDEASQNLCESCKPKKDSELINKEQLNNVKQALDESLKKSEEIIIKALEDFRKGTK